MGLLPEQYYEMSPLEFYYASVGYMERYWKQWDMTRHMMYTIASTVPSKRKLPKINRWMPLPIDRAGDIDISAASELLKKLRNGGERTTS